MKSFPVFFFALLALFRVAPLGRAGEPASTGDWSAPVNGLRARLLFAEDAPFHGTRIGVIYLELQNVTDVLGELLVDFKPPQFALVDAQGKQIPQGGFSADYFTAWPGTLILPHDSTLRFRVSVSGYGIQPNSGLALQLDGAFWVIPPGTRDPRFLTASFSVPELAPTDIEGRRQDVARGHSVWRGTLTLPRLAIPAK